MNATPCQVDFPAQGINRKARRKPTTFGRVLTNSFHVQFKTVLTSVVGNHFNGSNECSTLFPAIR